MSTDGLLFGQEWASQATGIKVEGSESIIGTNKHL